MRVTSKTSMPSWIGLGRAAPGEPSQRQRKKSVAEEKEEEDDRHIRFKIGGVGQRMTKEDFIEEMKKLDKNTRREVVDQSSASHVVKTLAREDPPPSSDSRGKGVATRGADGTDVSPGTTESSQNTSGSSSRSPSVRGRGTSRATSSSQEPPETAVEQRRRLAVLRGVAGGDDDSAETPAERRRREAALGVSSHPAEDDSDDDDTPRVPPARRGIRFADTPERREA